jgi:5'-nucleotidase
VFDGIEAWECSGTPVDCVKLAKHVVLKDREIDLCVSGVNHGSNASINILYSGTMSAAMEAAVEGIRSVGFSLLDFSFDADFGPSKYWADKVMRYMLAEVAPSGRLLNVNIPKLPLEQIKGLRVCRQADGKWVEKFVEGRDPMGKPYYWLSGEFQNQDQAEDTDIKALEMGYVSVVPSMHDLTDYKYLPLFKNLEHV